MHELGGVRQIEVDQLSTIVADRMIVAIGFAIVAAGTVSKVDFVNEAGFFQVAQRVVNGRVADTGQSPAGCLKDVAGSRMIVSLQNDLKNCVSLGGQLRLFLDAFHGGFRLILNERIVKPRDLSTDYADIFCVICG